MQKIEYTRAVFKRAPTTRWLDFLRERGERGWKLCDVQTLRDGTRLCTFMRPLE